MFLNQGPDLSHLFVHLFHMLNDAALGGRLLLLGLLSQVQHAPGLPSM